ncbi:MAG: amidohydrolase family protein [Parcubacteria group bacterium]|nr:amidohydrolase family protein [Parcubacteria group bacterium]
MIIDTHAHIFNEEVYQTYTKKSAGKINRILTLHFWINLNDIQPTKRTLEEVLSFAETKEDLFVIAAINITYSVKEQLEKIKALLENKKIVGIKMYPGYQHFYPSDEIVFPIAELCEQYNKPLIFHSGDVFDRLGTAELKYSHPIHVDSLATHYPQCTIIIAHFGFPYLMETATIVNKNKNVFTEISGTIDTPSQDIVDTYTKDLKRVFSYYPAIKQKIMFGTDYGGEHTPLNQIDSYIQLVENVFSTEEQDNVFHKLAEKLFFS